MNGWKYPNLINHNSFSKKEKEILNYVVKMTIDGKLNSLKSGRIIARIFKRKEARVINLKNLFQEFKTFCEKRSNLNCCTKIAEEALNFNNETELKKLKENKNLIQHTFNNIILCQNHNWLKASDYYFAVNNYLDYLINNKN